MATSTISSFPDPLLLGGVLVHPISLNSLLHKIKNTVISSQRSTIMYANAHAIMLAQRNSLFKQAINQADIVFCDGYGVWLAAQVLGYPLPERFTPPDWIMQFAALCVQQNYRLFLLGAEPGIARGAAQQLTSHYPDLQCASHHGYFDLESRENDKVLQKINTFSPDILLVGMGMPRQELWIQQNLDRHSAPIVISVGALFDYLAGHLARGPRWLTDSGGEWLWRLCMEPRRLWRRYLLGNPSFVWLIFRQWLETRHSY